MVEHEFPDEVVTDRATPLRAAVEDLVPSALHNTAQYAD